MTTDRHRRLRDVLLTDWDPTDAARNEHAHGAYDGYIPPLLDLIRSDAGEDAIVDFLYDREREIMCFPGLGRERLRRVARRLITAANAQGTPITPHHSSTPANSSAAAAMATPRADLPVAGPATAARQS